MGRGAKTQSAISRGDGYHLMKPRGPAANPYFKERRRPGALFLKPWASGLH